MTATAQEVLWLASQYVGYVEGPNNWNEFATRVDGGRWQNQPWCGVFCKDILTRASSGVLGEPSPVYTPAGAAGYQRIGRAISRNGNCKPGDLIFFDWGGSQNPAAADHVGFLTGVYENGDLATIEGNTQSGNSGDQSNGGGCYRRRRPRSTVVLFGRPNYLPEGTPAPIPPPTQPLQTEDDDMKLIDAPDGSIWAISGLWRNQVSIADANGLAFIGVPRTKANPEFWGMIERTTQDVHAVRLAAWWSTRVAQHFNLTK
jgi:hypothetical protein